MAPFGQSHTKLQTLTKCGQTRFQLVLFSLLFESNDPNEGLQPVFPGDRADCLYLSGTNNKSTLASPNWAQQNKEAAGNLGKRTSSQFQPYAFKKPTLLTLA